MWKTKSLFDMIHKIIFLLMNREKIAESITGQKDGCKYFNLWEIDKNNIRCDSPESGVIFIIEKETDEGLGVLISCIGCVGHIGFKMTVDLSE